MQQKFPKRERLNSKKFIQELFSKGSAFTHYPYKVICLPLNQDRAREAMLPAAPGAEPPTAQVLFSCSKRSFKKAVDRNRVKRKMRESYRLNKHLLPSEPHFLIAYIYIAKEILPSSFMEEKLKTSFKRLGNIAQSST